MRDFIQGKGRIVTTSGTYTGNWNYILALSDVVISSYDGAMEDFPVGGLTIPAGFCPRIDAKSVTIDSGNAFLYHE